MGRRELSIAAAGLAASAALAAPAGAGAAPHDYLAATDPSLGGTTLSLKGGGRPEILSRVVLRGAIPIPGPNKWVTVKVSREGREIASRRLPTDPRSGRYRTRLRLTGCCRYLAQAAHGSDISAPLRFEVSGPPRLDSRRHARLFNRLLRKHGYRMGEAVDHVDAGTGLGIMALRKVHDLPRSESYEPGLFELLLRGQAGFEPLHREDGRHVEVDVSRQVMALVEDGEVAHVFHVSTGSGGTPRGEWSFYDKAPGYNSLGMYYSAYYDGNYATHGFASVPTYPASHGCTRNPIPYAVYIYDWISVGDRIYVYD